MFPQHCFRNSRPEVQGFEDAWIFGFIFRPYSVIRPRLLPPGQHQSHVLGKGSADVELGIELVVNLANQPTSAQRLGFVDLTRVQVIDRGQFCIIGPQYTKA